MTYSQDFADLDVGRDVSLQLELLQEDLLQVRYPNDITLDVGWYPAFRANGRFVIQIIKSKDWDKPVFVREFSDIKKLKSTINEALGLCTGLSRGTGD